MSGIKINITLTERLPQKENRKIDNTYVIDDWYFEHLIDENKSFGYKFEDQWIKIGKNLKKDILFRLEGKIKGFTNKSDLFGKEITK